jgi:hypothetical protein
LLQLFTEASNDDESVAGDHVDNFGVVCGKWVIDELFDSWFNPIDNPMVSPI